MSLVRAKTSFMAPGHQLVAVGRVFDSSDPLVVARPDLFEAVAAQPLPGGVEQATAAPGEKRAVKRTAAKKSRSKG